VNRVLAVTALLVVADAVVPLLPLRGSAGLTALQAGGIGLRLELHMLDVGSPSQKLAWWCSFSHLARGASRLCLLSARCCKGGQRASKLVLNQTSKCLRLLSRAGKSKGWTI
jgi:hypothetical protein